MRDRRWIFGLVLAAFVLGFIELMVFVGVRWAESRIRKAHIAGVFWRTASFSEEELEEAFRNRDPELGWPTPEFLASDRYDEVGARPSPAFPVRTRPCVAAFGDSFTYGQEASDDDAWGNQLARKLGCRVANFGVPGYGVDQAYLRYRRKQAEIAGASVVVIGFFPENIMRHVNQYVGFRVARPNLLFKPRFVPDAGGLRVVPPITREAFDVDLLNADPAALFPYEFFLPDTEYGPVVVGFPYTWTFVRALMHPRVRSALRGEPTWIDLFQPPSEALELTKQLIASFVRDVEASGKQALVFVFTNAGSVETYVRDGRWPYASLLDFLDERGIRYEHVGERFAANLGAERVCEVFTRETLLGCTGHYTPEGYSIVAELIAGRLRADGLVPGRR